MRLVHSKPYSPQGRGKQERLNRYIREAFLAEATHQGIEGLDALNDLFAAWAEQVCNRRLHAETGQAPIDRFEQTGPHRAADPDRLREAFRWSLTRRVTRTATVALEGNAYGVDPALVGRRVRNHRRPALLSRAAVVLMMMRTQCAARDFFFGSGEGVAAGSSLRMSPPCSSSCSVWQ
ncbi:MAG TPA: hypothetical protein VGJ95_10050 [Pseudonocardiaceae bacterium]